MTLLLVSVFVLVALAGGAGAGLVVLTGWAESRRDVRWSHTLARFCGNPSCGICRSRSLSGEVPRLGVKVVG
ncbi:hypothetical protein ACQP1W_01075 [Spirillospora sp. CA-255316]